MNKSKPRRSYVKATKQTTKRISMELGTAVSQVWNIQLDIDNYNKSLIESERNDFFEDAQVAHNAVIIRPFKENYIKEYIETTKTASAVGFRRIDNRKLKTDQENYVFSPFKYINAGILMSASDEFLKERNMSLGDVVYIKTVQWMNCRFYLDRQIAVRDYVESQDNWSLGFFEGYFNISQFDVELSIPIEKFKAKHMSNVMSPIYGKTTLEELIAHHTILEEQVKAERESLQQDKTTTDAHVGVEVNISDVTEDGSTLK
jgi:hypothetical protein